MNLHPNLYHKYLSHILKQHFTFIHLFFVLSCTVFSAHAQSLTLEKDYLTDYLRNKQLADSNPPIRSFCVRPLSMQNGIEDLHLQTKISSHFSILPFSITTQINSHHPFGWNDGSMIPSNGAEVLVSGGIYAQAGRFTLQVQPEIIYAQNSNFETFPTEYPGVVWNSYYKWLNRIDNPEQFGTGTYKKFFPGQSSLYFHPKNLAIGVSTENIWWGPSIQNSLVMSNNAPGFFHADIHTTAPIPTKIGSFEFQVLGGLLQNSNILPVDTNKVFNSSFLYQPKLDDARYITGMVVSWQPKWVKGLFLGFSNAAYLYKKDISGIADVLPLPGILVSNTEKQNKRGVLGSIFLRYVMPEENAEFYAEYGRSDRTASIINLLTDKDYPRGYIVGMRKLSNLRPNKSRMEFSAEIAQLELPTTNLINNAQSWYTNDYVRQGFTNQGKVLGAGIGPGGNSQMLDISWIKADRKIGLQLERIVHNNDFYYNLFSQTGEWQRHWIDLYAAAHARWKVKTFYINAELGLSRSLNYEWYVITGSSFLQNGYDFLNFHGKISVIYRL